MKKKLGKRLLVSTQTLRRLTAPGLAGIAGGVRADTKCTVTCAFHCASADITLTGCPTCA